MILKNGKVGSQYNIGGNNELSNIYVVKEICKILEQLIPATDVTYHELINFVHDRPGHDLRYAIDSHKFQVQLNWRPQTQFNDGLTKTIQWYIKQLSK